MLCNSNGPEYCGLLCHSTLFLVKLESALALQQQGALVQLQASCLGIQGRLWANKQASKWFAYSVNKGGCLTTATAAGGKLGRLLLALHEVINVEGRLLNGAQEAEDRHRQLQGRYEPARTELDCSTMHASISEAIESHD